MTLKAWLKGRLYLAPSSSTEASPLGKVVDFSYNQGQASEEVRYAGATVTTVINLLSNPQVQVNWIRDTTENLVVTAARWWRGWGTRRTIRSTNCSTPPAPLPPTRCRASIPSSAGSTRVRGS